LYLFVNPDDLNAIFYQGFSFLKVGDTTNAKTNALRIIELEPVKEVFFSGEHLLNIYDLEMSRKIVKQSLEDAHVYMEEEKSIASKSLGNIKLTEAFQKLNNAWLYSSGMTKEDRDLKSTILKDIFFVYPKMKDKPDIPEIARKYMVQATSATGEKNYKDAIALWNKVLDISPYFSIAYFNNALIRELSGDYRNSIEDMKKYLELYPDAPDARGAKDKIYEWERKIKN
jgi:tetratricopeptide (TPR) repeat protein